MMKTESELIKLAKRGDEESFEALILSCKSKAYNLAFRYMGNEDDALDALQESFIKIFRHLSKFNEESRFDTWVYRIVVNCCNDMLKKNKRDYHDEITMDIVDASPGPAAQLEKKEESAYIIECLNRLGDEHKEILILRDVQEFAYDEIAEILDCSIGTVKSRISRARQKLKEIYFSAAS